VDAKAWTYVAYLVVSVGITIWVATTLSRNGLVFLEEVFADSRLARSVNKLLVMGFYLLNLGFSTALMRSAGPVPGVSRALEILSQKLGVVLLVLGALHLLNVYALNRFRQARPLPRRAPMPAPGWTPAPAGPPTGSGPWPPVQ
jgi:hypothetical protein